METLISIIIIYVLGVIIMAPILGITQNASRKPYDTDLDIAKEIAVGALIWPITLGAFIGGLFIAVIYKLFVNKKQDRWR